MLSTRSIVLVALVVVSVWQCCACGKFSIEDDYLEVPKPVELNDEYHQNVRKGMLELKSNIGNWFSADGKESEATSLNTERGDVYNTIRQLAEKSQSISPELIKMLKSMLALARDDQTGELANFKNVLAVFSSKLIGVAQYREYILGTREVKDFDRLFSAALTTSVHLDMEKKLREFDLRTDQYHARHMMRVANDLIFPETNKQRVAVFIEVMDERCAKLLKDKARFDQINLARVIAHWSFENKNVLRLNEYYRICLTWNKPEIRKKIINDFRQRLEE